MNEERTTGEGTNTTAPENEAGMMMANPEGVKDASVMAAVEAGVRPGEGDGEEFELPDGFDPGDYAEGFRAMAKELGLKGAQSERLLGFWAEVAADVEASRADALTSARREWAAATMRDREIGGENLERTIGLASTVVNAFGTEGLKEVFRASGLGNHPEVIRFMSRIGRVMGEDLIHRGESRPSQAGKSAAELIYGKK